MTPVAPIAGAPKQRGGLTPFAMNIANTEARGVNAEAVQELNATPTAEAYGELQEAFDYYNRELFGNGLPPCLITLQRRSKRTRGYFSHRRFRPLREERTTTDEIAMNPLHFNGRTVTEILSTLVHEMAHLWQAHFGHPSRGGYHNKQWATKMEAIGLMPSDTGEPGGAKTGQRMTHFVVVGGRFESATAALIANGFGLSWAEAGALPLPGKIDMAKSGRRVTYVCRSCGAKAWGKFALSLVCGDCARPMRGELRP